MANIGKSIQRTTQLWRRLSQQSGSVSTGLRLMSTTEPVTTNITQQRAQDLHSLPPQLDGQVAIITGGAEAIGAATTKLFTAHGAKVIIADVNDEQGEKLAHEVGSNAVYRRTDVTSEENVASTVAFAVKEFGKLDTMYNNAGVVTPLETFEKLDMEQYDRYTAVMVRGLVCGIKHAARAMIPQKSGVILNTGSTASVAVGYIMPLIYNINKQNIPGITKISTYHLAKHGIRVNAISPHGIPSGVVVQLFKDLGSEIDLETVNKAFDDSSPIPNRHTTNEDIAKGALFSCSDECGYISGQNLVVDAGFCNSVVFDPLGMGDPFKDSA